MILKGKNLVFPANLTIVIDDNWKSWIGNNKIEKISLLLSNLCVLLIFWGNSFRNFCNCRYDFSDVNRKYFSYIKNFFTS